MITAKVLSVTPKPYSNGTKTLYTVVCDNGKTYTCFSADIAGKVNQSVSFEEVAKEYNGQQQFTMNLPRGTGSSFGGGGGFQKKAFVPSARDSKESIVISYKTMLLSYCKDLAISHKSAKFEEVLANVKAAYEALLPLLNLESIKTPEIASGASTGAVMTATSVASIMAGPSPAKVAIMKNKARVLKFRANDVIDFIYGTIGVSLKYIPENDDVDYNGLTDEQANTIINAMSPEAG